LPGLRNRPPWPRLPRLRTAVENERAKRFEAERIGSAQ
jgi:hypothetical protein